MPAFYGSSPIVNLKILLFKSMAIYPFFIIGSSKSLDKSFDIGPLGMNIYVWVINVLNTQNVTNVYNLSGDAYDDGYLTSQDGSAVVEGYRLNYGEEFAQLYEDIYRATSYAAGNFGTPRQIRLGLRINY